MNPVETFDVARIGFKGNALFVYLAQPEGLGQTFAQKK
jgi:hypothetical protein